MFFVEDPRWRDALVAGGGSDGVAAAHYEGVKGDGESDTAVIERVLTAAGAEAKVDDIFVVKTLISDGKYSYTAYVYNGTAWGAMDGNYNAENVYFADDLTILRLSVL